MINVLNLSKADAGHVAVALAAHLKWWRALGNPVPEAVQELADTCTSAARDGLTRSELDPLAELVEAFNMTPLLLTYSQAQTALNCSDRHLRRLIDAGQLPAVVIGGAVRIRTTDLQTYVDTLPARPVRGDAAA
jgi:excisionase family DNA binding protein